MEQTRPTALFAVLLLAVMTLVSGCGDDGNAADSPAQLEGSWMLDLLGDAPVDPAVDSQLTLDGGKASGNAGVNQFNGSYDAPSNGVLTFGPLATTMMAGPDNAMKQEQAFLEALADTRAFTTEDGTLVLKDDGGNTVAQLELTGEG